MKDYGIVKSTVKPDSTVMDNYSVWVNSDIKEVTETLEGVICTLYQYNQKQYDKNEYIHSLSQQLTDAQVALCDVYEQINS